MAKCLSLKLNDIAQWDNLVSASYKAAKAKRDRVTVQQFFCHYEDSINQLQRAIMAAKLAVGSYRSFTISDPKPRIIHAAPFVDRVIHHALINCMGGRLEKSWLDSSYACRKGFGCHKAINKAAKLSYHYPIVIKLDVRSYFANIQHAILIKLLRRQFKGRDLFQLINNLLSSFSLQGIGIPIGTLTSQYFGNHYLDGYQRWLRHQSKVKGELRYMDDILIFCCSLRGANALVNDSVDWIKNNRGLVLKPAIIQSTKIGVTFCGFKVTADGIKLGLKRKRNYRKRLKQILTDVNLQQVEPLVAQSMANNLAALCLQGEHKNWQQRQLNKYSASVGTVEL